MKNFWLFLKATNWSNRILFCICIIFCLFARIENESRIMIVIFSISAFIAPALCIETLFNPVLEFSVKSGTDNHTPPLNPFRKFTPAKCSTTVMLALYDQLHLHSRFQGTGQSHRHTALGQRNPTTNDPQSKPHIKNRRSLPFFREAAPVLILPYSLMCFMVFSMQSEMSTSPTPKMEV